MISALIYIDDLFVKPLKTPVGGKVFESDRLQGHSLITIPNSCSCVCIKENLFIWLKAYSGRMFVLKKKKLALLNQMYKDFYLKSPTNSTSWLKATSN